MVSTPDRSHVWNVQTPQIFEYHLIKEAYEKALMHDSSRITDDAMVVEEGNGAPISCFYFSQ